MSDGRSTERPGRPRPRKRFGQHFLAPEWADKLVDAISPRPDDRMLEIGPGPGALTLRLAPRVAHLTAIEVDSDLIDMLRPQLPPNVDLVAGDVLDLDLAPLVAAGPLRVVGNLPYNITSPILFRLLEVWRARTGASASTTGSTPWSDATLMVQREVADRIEAPPGSGDYGPLAIAIQMHADVRRVLALPPGAFRPPPRVHSAVVRLSFRAPVVPVRDEDTFDAMVRSVFTQRRKTLGNALAPFASARGHDSRTMLAAAGIDPMRRPETLQLAELARLADRFADPEE